VRLKELNIDQIDVLDGIRQIIEEKPLEELVASIAKHGVLQPIVVEPGDEGRYRLQIGSRRLTAARMAGLETVPALVLDRPLGPEESLEVQLVENLHREDLDPIDEAEAYATLREMGVNVSEIARRVRKNRTYVSHSMRLLRLHLEVRDAVRQRTLEREHALTLLRLEPEQQLTLSEEIREKGLTLKETRERVRDILGKPIPWRIVPIRMTPEIYERLSQIAPEGDVAELLMQAVERLIS